MPFYEDLHLWGSIADWNEEGKNPTCEQNFTSPFHLVCKSGNFKIAKLLVDRYDELEIDLDSKAFDSLKAFKWLV